VLFCNDTVVAVDSQVTAINASLYATNCERNETGGVVFTVAQHTPFMWMPVAGTLSRCRRTATS